MGVFGAAPGNQWYAWPNYPLDTILGQSAVPYPTGVDDQIAAYNYIVARLSPPVGAITQCVLAGITYTGIRCEYVNLNLINAWAGYVTQVEYFGTQPPPDGVSQESWDAVTAQLASEFGYVGAVQQLYVNFNGAFTALFTANNSLLNALLLDALGSATATNNVKGTAAAVAEGVAYTILSAAGPEASVISNLIETGINAANTANGENFTAPFNGAADTLWTTLSNDFTTVLSTTASQETTILSDWGKLQQVGALALGAGPGSLEWRADSTSTFTAQGSRGYSVSVMQMLLPARYKITRLATQGDDSLIDNTTNGGTVDPAPPSYAQYAQFISNQINANQEFASDGPVYNKFYVSDGNGNYPSAAALITDTFNSGASPFDFFLGTNGWEGFRANGVSDQYLDCDGLITTVTNWTSRDLTVASVNDIGYQGGSLFSLYTRNGVVYGYTDNVELQLPPYATISFGSYYQGGVPNGLQFDFTIYDGSTAVARFDTHQHKCSGTDQTWIDNASTGSGYFLTTPRITTQSHSNPGIIEIGIYSNEY